MQSSVSEHGTRQPRAKAIWFTEGQKVTRRADSAAAGHWRLDRYGLLIPRLGDTEIFESICGQISREAERARYSLLWGDISQSAQQNLVAERTCEPYLRQRVAGVFFAPLELSAGKDEVNQRIASILSDAGIPIVLLDRDLASFPNRSRFAPPRPAKTLSSMS